MTFQPTILPRYHASTNLSPGSPPFYWVDTIARPSPHPDDVRPAAQLWPLARAGLTRSEMATRLHLTPEHCYLAAIRHPQPRRRRRCRSPEPVTDLPDSALSNEHEMRAYIKLDSALARSHTSPATVTNASAGSWPAADSARQRPVTCSAHSTPPGCASNARTTIVHSPTSPPTSVSRHPTWLDTLASSDSRSATASPPTSSFSPTMAARYILHRHLDRLRHPRSRPTHQAVSGDTQASRPQPRRQTPRHQGSSLRGLRRW